MNNYDRACDHTFELQGIYITDANSFRRELATQTSPLRTGVERLRELAPAKDDDDDDDDKAVALSRFRIAGVSLLTVCRRSMFYCRTTTARNTTTTMTMTMTRRRVPTPKRVVCDVVSMNHFAFISRADER